MDVICRFPTLRGIVALLKAGRWTKLKKIVHEEEKLPAVNFEIPASRIADYDLVSFIFEHLEMPDPDIQARWQIEPARVQRCRQRALKGYR